MTKTALTIVYNHRFEQNLPKLRSLYGERFSTLRQLMPFPRTVADDVIPVHDTSYRFQSFFAQAWSRLESIECDFHAFVGDDFILNPSLDETNLHAALKLDADTSFISELLPVTRAPASWWRLRTVLKELKDADGYFKWQQELPPVEVALERFEALGIPTDDLVWSPKRSVSGILPLDHGRRPSQWIGSRLAIAYLGHTMRYPLAWGYSDIVVVPRAVMPRFIDYCRVFAAMGMFVEAAVPSALALASPRVNTEADTGWRSTVAWRGEDQAALLRAVGPTLHSLADSFAPNEIGKHPVKLSTFTFGTP